MPPKTTPAGPPAANQETRARLKAAQAAKRAQRQGIIAPDAVYFPNNTKPRQAQMPTFAAGIAHTFDTLGGDRQSLSDMVDTPELSPEKKG